MSRGNDEIPSFPTARELGVSQISVCDLAESKVVYSLIQVTPKGSISYLVSDAAKSHTFHLKVLREFASEEGMSWGYS